MIFLCVLLGASLLSCLLWLWLGYRTSDTVTDSRLPSIELIITCRNEEQALPELLSRLSKLEWENDRLAFALVDDRSNDATQELMKRFVDADSAHRRLIAMTDEPSPFASPKKRAIEFAIEGTAAEWVVTLDADSRPHAKWLRAMFGGYGSEWIAIVPGFRFVGGSGWLARFRSMEALIQSFLMRGAIQNGRPLSAIGAGFAYSVAAYRTVGGFRDPVALERISGDDDLLLHKFAKLPGVIGSRTGEATLAIEDRDADQYWRARARHYSVAPDYPRFWLLFGVLAIPGAVLTPIFSTFSVLFSPSITLLVVSGVIIGFYGMTLARVARDTSAHFYWWYPVVLYFGLPVWGAMLLVTMRKREIHWR